MGLDCGDLGNRVRQHRAPLGNPVSDNLPPSILPPHRYFKDHEGKDRSLGKPRKHGIPMETCCEKSWCLAGVTSPRNGLDWSLTKLGTLRRHVSGRSNKPIPRAPYRAQGSYATLEGSCEIRALEVLIVALNRSI